MFFRTLARSAIDMTITVGAVGAVAVYALVATPVLAVRAQCRAKRAPHATISEKFDAENL